jgi:hypothetical protein
MQKPQMPWRASQSGQSREGEYLPPCKFLLEGLGIALADLQGTGTTSVSREFLRTLIGELVRRPRFDDSWYAENYPDVEGARLAGDIKCLHEHFTTTGYFEDRLPAELPFDPQWYRMYYRDIAEAFPSADPEAARTHFLTGGYFEGRAGTAEMLAEVDRWRALVAKSTSGRGTANR